MLRLWVAGLCARSERPRRGRVATREMLYRLIDQLPESELDRAQRLLESPSAGRDDAMLQHLLAAPLDDEPTTPDEDAGAREARQEYRRGEFLSADEAKRELLR